jgi:DNA polymerase III alpha subunit
LLEDEHGPINAIVKPKIYEECRSAVRMEPFVLVRGRLQKDGATMNVIASEVKGLRIAATPDEGELRERLPDTLEYWGHYLTALRQSPPGVKSWG